MDFEKMYDEIEALDTCYAPPFELPLCYVEEDIKPLPVGNGYSTVEYGTCYVNNVERIFGHSIY